MIYDKHIVDNINYYKGILEELADSEGPDQTARVQSDYGLRCPLHIGGHITRKELFERSFESMFQCACPFTYQGHFLVLWLTFPHDLPITWANSQVSIETVRMNGPALPLPFLNAIITPFDNFLLIFFYQENIFCGYLKEAPLVNTDFVFLFL